MILLPARPSRLKAMSMPRPARRRRPACARGFLGQPVRALNRSWLLRPAKGKLARDIPRLAESGPDSYLIDLIKEDWPCCLKEYSSSSEETCCAEKLPPLASRQSASECQTGKPDRLSNASG